MGFGDESFALPPAACRFIMIRVHVALAAQIQNLRVISSGRGPDVGTSVPSRRASRRSKPVAEQSADASDPGEERRVLYEGDASPRPPRACDEQIGRHHVRFVTAKDALTGRGVVGSEWLNVLFFADDLSRRGAQEQLVHLTLVERRERVAYPHRGESSSAVFVQQPADPFGIRLRVVLAEGGERRLQHLVLGRADVEPAARQSPCRRGVEATARGAAG